MRIGCAIASLVLGLTAAAWAQPANDQCAAATTIAALPFAASVDTSTAGSDPGDPISACDLAPGNVWYVYHATRAVSLAIDTIGSAVQPTVSVFAGACGSLVELGCHDDADDLDGNAPVVVPVAAGQTIYIVAGDANGGLMNLHVDRAPFDASPPTALGSFVLSGDPSPVGGAFATFGRPVLLSSKTLAFTANTEGAFADLGSGLIAVALTGDPTPVGGTFGTVGPPVLDAAGQVYFHASIDGGTAASALFRRDTGGVLTALVRAGDAAPGGGTFASFRSGIAASPSGLLAFVGRTSLSSREAIYLSSGGAVAPALLTETDPSPCGGIISGLGFGRPTIGVNDAGEVVAYVNANPDGIVRIAGGVPTAVACEGAPSPIGGTYGQIRDQTAINGDAPAGTIVFVATVTLPGPDPRVVFKADTGGVTVVARTGDLTLGGETITSLSTGPRPAINDLGAIAFQARTSVGNAVLLRTPTMAAAAIQRAVGTPCSAGGAFVAVDDSIALDDAGTLAFQGACTPTQGILTLAAGPGLAPVADVVDATPAGAGFSFNNPTIRGGRLAFEGARTGVFTRTCTTTGCGAVTTIATPLQPIPGLPGEVLRSIDADVLAGKGSLTLLVANTFGAGARREVLLSSRRGALSLVAATDLALPGTTLVPSTVSGDAISSVRTPVGTDGRGVAFVASVDDTATFDSFDVVYLLRNGAFTEIARSTLPTPNAETYDTFGAPVPKGRQVSFRGDTTSQQCLFRGDGTTATSLACDGTALPADLGGTIAALQPDVAGAGSRGPVMRATTLGATPAECLFSAATSGLATIACAGQPLPGGGLVEAFDLFDSPIIAAASRRVVTAARDAGTENAGVFGFGPGWVTRIGRDGGPAPGVVGGTLTLNDARPTLQRKTVAFLGAVTGGSRRLGIFRATLKR